MPLLFYPRLFGNDTALIPIVPSPGNYNSPHAAVAHSVQASILGLIGTKITGIVADSVRVRKVPFLNDFTAPNAAHALPGILIVYGDKERDLAGVNDRDDIGFPVRIGFIKKGADSQGRTDFESDDDVSLTWRKVISDYFRNQPYTITNYTVVNPLVFQTCTIEYESIFNAPRGQQDQLFVGAFTLIFVLRKFRGSNPAN